MITLSKIKEYVKIGSVFVFFAGAATAIYCLLDIEREARQMRREYE